MQLIKRIGGLIFALVICINFISCASANKPNESFGKGKRMILSFDANPSTGFDWEFELSEGEDFANLILERNETIDDNMAGIVGAPIKVKYYFIATKPGKQNLHFTYKRPWDGGETAYDVIYELNVDDDLNISCLSKTKGEVETSKDLAFFPNPVFE